MVRLGCPSLVMEDGEVAYVSLMTLAEFIMPHPCHDGGRTPCTKVICSCSAASVLDARWGVHFPQELYWAPVDSSVRLHSPD